MDDRKGKTCCCSLVTACLCLSLLVVTKSSPEYAKSQSSIGNESSGHTRKSRTSYSLRDSDHIISTVGASVTLNCPVNFPSGKPQDYEIVWEKMEYMGVYIWRVEK